MAMTPAGAVSPPPAPDAGAKNEATSPPTEEPTAEEKPSQLPPMPKPRNPERTNSLLDAAAGLTSLHDSASPSAEENKDAEAAATKDREAAKEDASPAPATDGLRPPHHRDWRTAYVRDHQLPSFAERELALRQAAALEQQMSPRLQGRLPPGMGSMSSLYPPSAGGYGHESLRMGGGYDPLASMPQRGAPGLDRYGLAVADQMAALDRPLAEVDRSFRLPREYPPYNRASDARAKLPTPHQLKPPTNAKNFPETLYEVITDPKFNHIIAWLPHGKGFMIHNKELFGSIILPAYFDGAKFTSFTRRLKRWRFKRTARGPELGAYYNKNFQRDREDMVAKMTYHPIDEDMAGEENDAAKTAEGTGDPQAKGKDADSEKSRIQKKVEEKVQAKLLQKEKEAEEEKASTNDNQPSPSSSGKKRKQHAEPQPSVSPEIITTPYYMDAHALPLPSTLPKRPKQVKAARSSKQGNKAGGNKGKSESEATKPSHAGHHQKLHHGPGSSGLPGLHPEYPTGGHPHGHGKDPRERRLAELEAELALIRSHRSAAGLGPPAPHGMAGPGGPLAASSSYLPAHVPSLDPLASSASRRILEVERAQRVLEAERVLEEERARVLRENGALGRGMPGYGDYGGALGREMIPPPVSSRLRHYDPALGAAGGFPPGFGKLNNHPTVDGEERPVMMSKKEEEEFAEYLLAKRESAKQARRYERLV